jgi:thiol-disulfide isomerase/thioredoxin
MIFLHINDSMKDIELFNKYVQEGKHVFVLIFMEGCGPCEETKPKWKQIETQLSKQYKNNNDIVVADINKNLLEFIQIVGSIEGFPTMKYIHKKGAKMETYEESNITTKDRSTSSFIQWIENKVKHVSVDKQKGGKRKSRKSKKMRKTRKYKK